MNAPNKRIQRSRIAALAFAGVFVVCAVVIGIVFSMNRDTTDPLAATPTNTHVPLTIQNHHVPTIGGSTVNSSGLVTVGDSAMTVGQLHISAPTSTVRGFTPVSGRGPHALPVDYGGGSLWETTRTITVQSGMSAFANNLQRSVTLDFGNIFGSIPYGWWSNTDDWWSAASNNSTAPVTNMNNSTTSQGAYWWSWSNAAGIESSLQRWSASTVGRYTQFTVTTVAWTGSVGTQIGNGYSTAWRWGNLTTIGGTRNGGITGNIIYTAPVVANTTQANLQSNSGLFRLWQTNTRVPLAGNANTTTFANHTNFPAWVQTRLHSQNATTLNVEIALTSDAPFGMFLKGAFLVPATTAAHHNNFAISTAQVSQRATSIIVPISKANWRPAWTTNTGDTSSFRTIHAFVGMYYHNANNATPTRPITFNLQGGNIGGNGADVVVQIPNNTAVAILTPEPTRTNYTFRHWSNAVGGTPWLFNTLITAGNTINATNTLHAVWGRNPVITFNTHGGSNVPDQTINWGTSITRPPDPTRFGYHFSHWSNVQDGVTHWNFNNQVTANTTLHAVFTEAAWRTMELRIGNPLNDTSMTMTKRWPENTIVTMGNFIPSHIDLGFLGWATSEQNARNKVVAFAPNANVLMAVNWTLYAIWDIEWENFPGIDGHNIIIFNFSGGLNPNSLIVEERQYFHWDPSSRILPTSEYMHNFAASNPDFNGLTFIGWYDNPSFIGQRHFSIPGTSNGPMSFYARWIEV
ncbi:MAG: InlB B-repeat-containing protein [Firmicutes bacterium]|nr:InlB B-repeat-containing protein [Bacillota bacterium]